MPTPSARRKHNFIRQSKRQQEGDRARAWSSIAFLTVSQPHSIHTPAWSVQKQAGESLSYNGEPSTYRPGAGCPASDSTAPCPHRERGKRGKRENRAFPKPMKCNCEHSSHGNSRIQGKKRKCKSDYQEGDEQGGKNEQTSCISQPSQELFPERSSLPVIDAERYFHRLPS